MDNELVPKIPSELQWVQRMGIDLFQIELLVRDDPNKIAGDNFDDRYRFFAVFDGTKIHIRFTNGEEIDFRTPASERITVIHPLGTPNDFWTYDKATQLVFARYAEEAYRKKYGSPTRGGYTGDEGRAEEADYRPYDRRSHDPALGMGTQAAPDLGDYSDESSEE